MRYIIYFFLSTIIPNLQGQNLPDYFKISGYLEAYYSYDFNLPDNHEKPDFLYNFKRHNEFSLNLALVNLTYEADKVRGNLSLMAGNYSQYNLADEPVWAQMIYEGSVGVLLKENLWLDVGVMPSHIGFESAIGMDTWHLSRSLLAENSPYFLTGARFTYGLEDNLDLIFWLTNGWQNVQRKAGNQSLGMGFGINYRPMEGVEFNYANYFGNEYPQTLRLNRFFNNFYLQYLVDDWGFTIGADYGIEEKLFSTDFNSWFGLTFSLKRNLSERLILATRGEYYSDRKAVILNRGMRISGFSLNLDYQLTDRSLIRVECRQFSSPENIFERPAGKLSKGNTAVNTSLALKF